MGIFPGFLSCSIDLYFCFHATTILFLMTLDLDYTLKSGSLNPPAPFLFLRIALAIQGLLCFHTNVVIYIMEYHSAIKKNKIMPFAATWMDLEIITLCEFRHWRTNITCYQLYVESKKKGYKWMYLENRNRLWKQTYSYQKGQGEGREGWTGALELAYAHWGMWND